VSLINLTVNMTRVAEALERIAVCMERAFPVPEFHETKKRGAEAIVRSSPAAQWEREQKQIRRKIREEEGLPPLPENE